MAKKDDFLLVGFSLFSVGAARRVPLMGLQRTTSNKNQRAKSKNELISDLWSLKLFTCQLPELRGAGFGAGAVVPVGANLVFAWEVIGNYGAG